MANEIILDTSILVEYVFATKTGKVAKEIIEDPGNIILVPSIVLAEFVSKLERIGNRNTSEIVTALGGYSTFMPVNWETCLRAGRTHAELKKIEDNISLVDCIIMEMAKEHKNAIVLTTDRHFKHYKNSKIL